MKHHLCIIVSVMMLLVSHTSISAEIEVPGLVTDNTITRIGHDFYREFTDHWEEEYPGSITINERPSARWGSWIIIKVDQDLLYQTFLYPNKRDFDKQVNIALASVYESLQKRAINKALLNTGDLTHDEF
ncbi:curli production assembly/transport protein CsgE [Kluyvera intermedia]|uniref:Curli production assembly/transport component CsgE n=1 Tax=Kluyvera intermedia TaxID=61648 RepID=A0ABX6DNX0_KLUIN|nr:curli production assembly/transport protein CsgE [Kluyvera intermedia]QGH30501.1 curli production assembly/transport protein CsgE [Kluyvera intermedia]QGH39483.1 curli production assembly/transport protein CsgE [Kluyvera intermedia]WQD28106.1 curli production assembly/transport protein CsgE [Kluyvera intermedia]VDZ83661.1 curli assembly protein CsgE [Kluyvera intermedia]